ncbi:MAG: sialate O-acetylesterase [Opitutaceae bacterium]
MKPSLFSVLSIALLGAATLRGSDLRLHPAFSDHMVLQREKPVAVFGRGKVGTSVSVAFGDQNQSTKVKPDGSWQVTLSALPVSTTPSVLTVRSADDRIECRDVLVGDVWFCSGQSNMARPFKSFSELTGTVASVSRPLVRIFSAAHELSPVPSNVPLPPTKKTEADFNRWNETSPAILQEASPLACYFAANISDTLKIPIGIFSCGWGATAIEDWIPRDVLSKLRLTDGSVPSATDPTSKTARSERYNALVHPFLGVTFKGFLWYQGESNSRWPQDHGILFPALINCWRERFHAEDRPFYFVQLAPYHGVQWDISGEAWAWLRESQTRTLRTVPRTGMAVITDLGEFEDIHPQAKEAAAARLARFALRDAGLPVNPVGPFFDSMTVEGGRCRIRFDHAESGLETRRVVMNRQKNQPIGQDSQAFVVEADQVRGFVICGTDGKFVEARAAIVGDHVEVWSEAVPAPVAVRYAWSNFPLCNLFNRDGLPAAPFRTDSFAPPLLQQRTKNKP